MNFKVPHKEVNYAPSNYVKIKNASPYPVSQRPIEGTRIKEVRRLF
jgi:hypothetical protein